MVAIIWTGGPYNMVHFIWSILYCSFHMIYFIWSVSYGPYNLAQIIGAYNMVNIFKFI